MVFNLIRYYNVNCTAAAALVVAIVLKKKKTKNIQGRKNDRFGLNLASTGEIPSAYNTLVQELIAEDQDEYQTFLRMSPENFDELLWLVAWDIKKQNTFYVSSFKQN